jgi:thiol-disulfide isomerase/thioredoxin
MKKLFFLSLLLLFSWGSFAQKGPQIQTDPKKQTPMLVGKIKRSHLQSADFNAWYQKEYSEYKPDANIVSQLKPLLKGVRIVLVMATWCSDSRREVPRFYQILDQTRFKEKHMKILCVDRDKKAGKFESSDLDIKLVPTFIIYRQGKELGRIIETPVESLEKDLLKILSSK